MTKRELHHDDSEYADPRNEAINEGDTEIATRQVVEPQVLTKQETMAIFMLRAIAVSVLVTATVLASWSVFRYSRHVEQEDFRTQYFDYASQVLASFRSSTERKLWSLEALSVALTSYCKSTNASWPLVTLPDFEERAESTRDLAEANTIAFVPVLINEKEKNDWEPYSIFNDMWLSETEPSANSSFFLPADGTETTVTVTPQIASQIFFSAPDGVEKVDPGPGPYTPMWQAAPIVNKTVSAVNVNVYRHPFFRQSVAAVLKSKLAVIGQALDIPEGYRLDQDPLLAAIVAAVAKSSNVSYLQPLSVLYFPVFDSFDVATRQLKGFFQAELFWQSFFTALLPPEVNGIVCVLRNSCGQAYTYQIWGQDVHFVGSGDLHDTSYDGWEQTTDFASLWDASSSPSQIGLNPNFCKYSLHVFPSVAMRDQYISSKPAVFTSVVVVVFLFTTLVFHMYDRLVERRQKKVMHTAVRSNEIVNSLYPTVVLDRLLRGGSNTAEQNSSDQPERSLGQPKTIQSWAIAPWSTHRIGVHRTSSFTMLGAASSSETGDSAKQRLKNFLTRAAHKVVDDSADEEHDETRIWEDSKPIATLFPNTTVMYADICGFTAWSSTREPSQVFTLLESVFRAFDHIAKRHGVFKVETIGDCYVAVAGVPEPQQDHAVIMARFASECRLKMKDVTRKLEVMLGPDTAELSMRFGLHSGPVTAGVLRGEKSRFQLYGNTALVAAKMENSGRRNCVHISQETADLLCAADKCHWIASQEESAEEGGQKSYWLKIPEDSLATHGTSTSENIQARKSPCSKSRCVNCGPVAQDCGIGPPCTESEMWEHASLDLKVSDCGKVQRLIDWNVDVLQMYLKAIVCRRKSGRMSTVSPSRSFRSTDANRSVRLSLRRSSKAAIEKNTQPIEELTEIVTLPRFDARAAKRLQDPEAIDLKPEVVFQLRDYVASIASMYGDHPFHNFEHASHVVLSASKLLKRIVAPNHLEYPQTRSANDLKKSIASDLHEFTYGITSDPLTQFSVVFAALIHDVDHPGVSNMQLVKEKSPLAKYYKGKSVAEQNSVDVAWELLQSSKYNELRKCIYCTEDDAKRFRQLVVNLVLATDIFDKELKALRDNRWAKAFPESPSPSLQEASTPLNSEEANRKATIVIEHIIQASDVAHTMQHWHIYSKWNQRLLAEMNEAFTAGRGDKDPSIGWYQGELAFYDNYIIPLAKKLKDCGVFGVASVEYLNFALKNREEWAAKGESTVDTMLAACSRRQAKEQASATSYNPI